MSAMDEVLHNSSCDATRLPHVCESLCGTLGQYSRESHLRPVTEQHTFKAWHLWHLHRMHLGSKCSPRATSLEAWEGARVIVSACMCVQPQLRRPTGPPVGHRRASACRAPTGAKGSTLLRDQALRVPPLRGGAQLREVLPFSRVSCFSDFGKTCREEKEPGTTAKPLKTRDSPCRGGQSREKVTGPGSGPGFMRPRRGGQTKLGQKNEGAMGALGAALGHAF